MAGSRWPMLRRRARWAILARHSVRGCLLPLERATRRTQGPRIRDFRKLHRENYASRMALVEDAGFPHLGNCSLDVRSKGRSCIRSESFGCLADDRPGVWVRGGCRGQFAVNSLRVACGHPGLGEEEQRCHAVRFRSAGTDTTDVWAAGSVRSLDDSKRCLLYTSPSPRDLH